MVRCGNIYDAVPEVWEHSKGDDVIQSVRGGQEDSYVAYLNSVFQEGVPGAGAGMLHGEGFL